MSRVGKMPVKIPEKVKVSVDGHLVKVEGPKGKMSFATNPIVKVQVDKSEVKEDDKTSAAKKVGAALARAAKDKGIEAVVFDRNGFDYHGRIQAVAAAAREAGLKF